MDPNEEVMSSHGGGSLLDEEQLVVAKCAALSARTNLRCRRNATHVRENRGVCSGHSRVANLVWVELDPEDPANYDRETSDDEFEDSKLDQEPEEPEEGPQADTRSVLSHLSGRNQPLVSATN